jgi:hypothetical protein
MPNSAPDLAVWLHHLADEADAAYLYAELSRAERDPKKAKLYAQLSKVEERHVEMWRKLLAEQGHEAAVPGPSFGARSRAWVARRVGARSCSRCC